MLMSITKTLGTCLLGLLAAGILTGGAPAGENGKQGKNGTVILDARSFWRCRFTMATPVVRTGGKVSPENKVALPPSDWTGTGFDDSRWARIPGPFFHSSGHAYRKEVAGAGYTWFEQSSTNLALICMRGRFEVTDPKAVRSLKLELAYRGGVVVYINGKEVARKHLPAGKIDAAALADDYPPEAFVRPDGKIIRWGFGDPKKCADRLARRIRRTGSIAVPTDALRKGANVLAVEIHRAPYHRVVLLGRKKTFYGGGNGRRGGQRISAWTTVGLVSASLRARGAGVVPNTARPAGLQVWNANPMQAVFDLDYGDAGLKPGPVKIVGTRNGSFSGQVVVSSRAAIKGLRVEVEDLVLDGGKGKILASAIKIRYARTGGGELGADGRYPGSGRGKAQRFDALVGEPPADVPVRIKKLRGLKPGQLVFGAVQPVWITVSVPADAPAGKYVGKLKLSTAGAGAVEVPVHLEVSAWRLPDPKSYRTFVDFIQSPESLALKYKVPLWSEEHWKLVAESMKLLGQVGNRTLYVPLICKTHFGNSQSMVRWVKKDGKSTLDFTLFEKYLDLAAKHMGKPQVIVFYVFERYTGPRGSFGKGEQDPLKWGSALITEIDAGGAVKDVEAPKYTTPEAEKFWGPLMKGLRERLAKRGLEDSMMLGLHGDFTQIPKPVAALFKKVAPGARWVSQGHGLAKVIHGVAVGYATTVWNNRWPVDPARARYHGWRRKEIVCQYPRDMVFKWPLTTVRRMAEHNIAGKQRGIGRLGADFWPVLKSIRGGGNKIAGTIAGRYSEHSSWGQLTIKTAFLAPGKRGAISTVRFEMIRESVQECEARILIDEALLDAGKRARLGEALAKRCQQLLDERVRVILRSGRVLGHHYFVGSGWQERSRQLFAAAAEVAARLDSK
jgi:Glycoside hydrolase 123, catalytic domain/Glycoside hydrolase 123 N-terminal domain